MNLKGVINKLNKFSKEHHQINDFGYGDVSNITTKDHDFVLMWIEMEGSEINKSSMNYTFNIYILDLLKHNHNNYIDVLNDTLLISQDIISVFYDQETVYGFTVNENGVNVEFVERVFDDYLAGTLITIDVEIKQPLNKCAVPYDFGEPIPPTPPTPQTCTLEKRSDYVFTTIYDLRYTYQGVAPNGSDEGDDVWKITKLTNNYNGDVVLSEVFTDVNWTDRYTY